MTGQGQNTSTAVMQRRVAGTDSLDLYPTPPWATRALCRWLENQGGVVDALSAWDPACGEHDMARPLAEYFRDVLATDIAPYRGNHDVEDFLWPGSTRRADWIITNPPFQLGEQFAAKAFDASNHGAALLVRTAFLESSGRYQRLFSVKPPSDILQFTERVVMHHGKLSQFGSTATAYCWIVWAKAAPAGTRFHWIPPCRKLLERAEDYADKNLSAEADGPEQVPLGLDAGAASPDQEPIDLPNPFTPLDHPSSTPSLCHGELTGVIHDAPLNDQDGGASHSFEDGIPEFLRRKRDAA